MKLMNYLMVAAELGKDVTVLLELKARFDEANNISWVNGLQEAGCKILYGLTNIRFMPSCVRLPIGSQRKTG